jgi:NADH-quinone oxidoreductase subunit F
LRERRCAEAGYYEVEVGSITMGELINDICGGMKPGRT